MTEHERLLSLLSYDPDTGVFTWKVDRGSVGAGMRAGAIRHDRYRQIRFGGRIVAAHRLAWFYVTGSWPKMELDHRNNERDDNRFCNLREATSSENKQNTRGRNARSGFKGVTFDPATGRYQARVFRKHLGRFDTPEEAHAAYVEAAKRMFGEFARAA